MRCLIDDREFDPIFSINRALRETLAEYRIHSRARVTEEIRAAYADELILQLGLSGSYKYDATKKKIVARVS